MIGHNELCSDVGKIDIDENDCKTAAEEKGVPYIDWWVDSASLSYSSVYPKGCYIANAKGYRVGAFFNRISVGRRSKWATPICSNQGKA